MNFFSRLWGSTFGSFKNVFNFLLPVLKSSAGKMIDAGLPIALSIVADLEKGQLPGPEKRSEAFIKLRDALFKEGYSAGTSILNLIIEMAVAKLKAQ